MNEGSISYRKNPSNPLIRDSDREAKNFKLKTKS